MRVYYDRDADLNLIKGKKVAIIGYGRSLPNWMKIEGVSQLKGILAEVVIVVLIVIFARVVV
ncbi:MAG TPA: YqhA family protein, partial [Methyloceanibacter sp.]|nr:YqhA family protein [Methyloceanibacter sp.]